jgi:hypothetical protein
MYVHNLVYFSILKYNGMSSTKKRISVIAAGRIPTSATESQVLKEKMRMGTFKRDCRA